MIALDASAIICLVERIDPPRTEVANLIRAAGAPWLVSTVALIECMTRPKALQGSPARPLFELFFSSAEVLMAPVTIQIALRAAEIRSTTGLQTPDSIHLATAIDRYAEGLITTDQYFARCTGRFGIDIRLLQRSSTPRFT